LWNRASGDNGETRLRGVVEIVASSEKIVSGRGPGSARFRPGHPSGVGYSGNGTRMKLPEVSFGEFLNLTPEELREELSAQAVTP
jgi:hypothetical protein